MTSRISKKAKVTPATFTKYYLETDKDGIPVNGQVGRTSQIYTGAGGTIVASGANDIYVNSVLTSPLTIDMTDIPELVNRRITVMVRPAAGDDVVLQFPESGYTVYVQGAGAAVTSYTMAEAANANAVEVVFSESLAVVIV